MAVYIKLSPAQRFAATTLSQAIQAHKIQSPIELFIGHAPNSSWKYANQIHGFTGFLPPGVTVVWDIVVVGWEVSYKEEFVPDDDGSYTVLIRKQNKMEESVRSSFYISEPGRVVLTLENRTHKRKRVLYRFKLKPATIPSHDGVN
ncbi:hypothetical protein ACLOJK_009628 [Asimina triloba]